MSVAFVPFRTIIVFTNDTIHVLETWHRGCEHVLHCSVFTQTTRSNCAVRDQQITETTPIPMTRDGTG